MTHGNVDRLPFGGLVPLLTMLTLIIGKGDKMKTISALTFDLVQEDYNDIHKAIEVLCIYENAFREHGLDKQRSYIHEARCILNRIRDNSPFEVDEVNR